MFRVNELLEASGGRLICGSKDIKIGGVSIDSRTIKPGEAFMAIKGENFDGHDFIDQAIKKRAGCIIQRSQGHKVTRSQDTTFIEVKDTIKALGDIAKFWRNRFDIPVVAVTGSNGKTTTKEMIAWVLSKRFKVLKNEGTKNNQIGLPLTLLKLKPNYDMAVVEAGTNHFGEINYLAQIACPNIGIITNIACAHLEYLRDLKGVFQEKYRLIKNLQKPYFAILNSDDSLLHEQVFTKNKKPFILSFGIKKRSDFFASRIKVLEKKIEFYLNLKYKFILQTLGQYNIYNALAAITVARLFGMEYPDIIQRLALFKFPEGRLNLLTLNKTRVIDDTYNSNPFSLGHALDALANFYTGGRKIFIMGDMLELGRREKLFHAQMGRKVKEACDVFITVGGLSKFTAQAAKDSGFDRKNIFTCASSLEARDILFNQILPKPDDIILIKGSRLMRMEEIFKA